MCVGRLSPLDLISVKSSQELLRIGCLPRECRLREIEPRMFARESFEHDLLSLLLLFDRREGDVTTKDGGPSLGKGSLLQVEMQDAILWKKGSEKKKKMNKNANWRC